VSTAKPSTSRPYQIEIPKDLDLDAPRLIELYRYMMLNRRLEERLDSLYRQNKVVGSFFSSLGQEATSVGTAYALQDGDFVGPMIRNLGSTLVRGTTAKDWLAHYLARDCSPTRGKCMHFGVLEAGIIACISVLGTQIPVMAGIALAFKQRDQKNVALVYSGDGGTSTTDFHEGLNLAAVQRVPLILVVEHNHYAYSTPVSAQFPTKDLIDKACEYGMEGEIFDGNNVLAAYDAAKRARSACLRGEGPVFLESKTFRRKGHAEHDPADYVPKKLRAEWVAKDPLDAYTRFLIDEGIATETDLEEVDERITREIDESEQEVLESPFPDSRVADEDVYYSDDGGTR
jgi:TPP-dependent pyruvate/acetoin dehydrogenase alpha subunit